MPKQTTLIFAALILVVTNVIAQTNSDVERIVLDLATDLKENYILEDYANKMNDKLLTNLEKGDYYQFEIGKELADKLQNDVRSINNDKHLRIRYGSSGGGSGSSKDPRPYFKYGIGEVNILEDNIGYLDITGFSNVTSTMKKELADKIEQIIDKKAIILDLRNNGGGSPAAVQLISSYFLNPGIHLNSLYFRNRDIKSNFYTHDEIEGKSNPDVELYILTSSYTFSAGEEFCYNLKQLKRATLIGEVTGGGAHPVDRFNLPGGIVAIIPVGMAINPISGTNWEGVGVIPDILIDESEALDKALELIRNKFRVSST